jgi:integrase
MPLKVVEPRNNKTKNLYIRGTYLGVRVDKSSGTLKRRVANAVLKRLEGQIERGEYPAAPDSGQQETFLSAANAYMEAGGSKKFIKPLIRHFGETPLAEIGQDAINSAAVVLYPNTTNATRNRCTHTPVSAILHHHYGDELPFKLKRPKGGKGRIVTDWLRVEDARGIIAAAETLDPELATLLLFLIYTGVRLGAALDLRRADVRIDEQLAWVRHQKGQPASDVRLRADLVEALARHLRSHNHEAVFRFRQGGYLWHLLLRAKLGYLGIACPNRRTTGWRPPPNRLAWCNFHSFRHSWATWMRRAGTDVKGLVATGNWKDEKSAARYAHAVAREEWERVDRLPSLGTTRGVRSA